MDRVRIVKVGAIGATILGLIGFALFLVVFVNILVFLAVFTVILIPVAAFYALRGKKYKLPLRRKR